MPHAAPPDGDIPSGGSPLSAKSKEEFAACLRELRAQAGTPSFRHLARVTHYSSSTLAEATSGRRLPTEPVLKAFAAACGADPAPWVEQLRRIATADQRGHPDAAGQDSPVPTGGRAADGEPARRLTLGRPLAGRWPAAALAAGGLAVLAIGLAIGWAGASAASAPSPAPTDEAMELPGVPAFSGTPVRAASARVGDGTDPVAGRCKADRRLVDRVPVTLGGVQVGTLDLWYSSWCGAGWADLYLDAGQPIMMGEVTVRSRDDRFSTIANPLVNQVDDYTDVIVPGRGGCLGAGAAVYEAGKSIMTAVIPCEVPTLSSSAARPRAGGRGGPPARGAWPDR